MRYKTLITSFILFACLWNLSAQLDTSYTIQILDTTTVLQQISMPDSLASAKYTSTFINDSYAEGYVPTLTKKDRLWQIIRGEQYIIKDIKIDRKDLPLISAAGLGAFRWKDQYLTKKSLSYLPKKILAYLENNGYPYASIFIDDTSIEDGKLSGTLNIRKGDYITYDSLTVMGDAQLNKQVLSRYIDIQQGRPYNLSKFLQIKKRIGELHYLKMTRDPAISFHQNTVSVELYLDRKPSSKFDFLIGVLPSETDSGQKYRIIGEFTGELHNRLGLGEHFRAEIKRLTLDNQQLGLSANFPFVFNFPIGSKGTFELFKKGNEFIESKGQIGINYRLNIGTFLNSFVKLSSSRLVDIDEDVLLATNKLPRKLDVRYNGIGISYVANRVDYIYNPIKGFTIDLSTVIGRKSIIKNRGIESLSESFAISYDTLSLHSTQLETKVSAAYYIPVGTFGTIKTGADFAWIYNEEEIYENEYWRIGGNQKLRGFDELSISSDAYGLFNIEMRIIMGRNSYLALPFIDYALIHYTIEDEWKPSIGTGLGINFSTSAGLFNVSFALGRGPDAPWDFNNTKVHFGYVSLF